jgi:hypothetical protein
LIALFGAPHADDNHAVTACHAAVELGSPCKALERSGASGPGGGFSRAMSSPTLSRPTFPRSMKLAAPRSIWSSGSKMPRKLDKFWCRNPARAWPQQYGTYSFGKFIKYFLPKPEEFANPGIRIPAEYLNRCNTASPKSLRPISGRRHHFRCC